jgi:hypothetical protein
MKKLKRNLITLGLNAIAALGVTVLSPYTALAGQTAAGTRVFSISVFRANSVGNVWATIVVDQPKSANTACVAGPNGQAITNAFVLRVNTEAGRAMLQELTAAKLSGQSVTIVGTNACPALEGNPTFPGGLNQYEEIISVTIGQ